MVVSWHNDELVWKIHHYSHEYKDVLRIKKQLEEQFPGREFVLMINAEEVGMEEAKSVVSDWMKNLIN